MFYVFKSLRQIFERRLKNEMNALSENFVPAFLEARRRKVLNEYTENKKIFCLEESRDSSRKSTKYSLHNSYDVRNFYEVNILSLWF